jgi:riboflavin synthase
MFTGIIEEIGTVSEASAHRLVVDARIVLDDLRLGDSINVSGACLTVVERSPEGFTVDLAEETLARTSLGDLTEGSTVNLERALTPTARMGGHVVQGHVDGVGIITELGGPSHDTRMTIEAPAGLDRYIVEKGFIAVEGISLTVTGTTGSAFGIAMIPYTLEHTVLGTRKAGDRVNLEADILAKYVERLVSREESDREGD